MKKYEVHWKDHFSSSGWKDAEEIEKWVKGMKKKRCVTIGFVAHQDKDVLVIASSFDGEGCYGDFQVIYKNHITEKTQIK